MNRTLDLIFRLFCLGQLFSWVRPYVLEGFARSLEVGGLSQWLVALSQEWPIGRWCVFVPCLAIVVLGAKRPLVLALAGGQVLDVGLAIASNSVLSGYSEKGVLLLVSLGAAGLLLVDTEPGTAPARRMHAFMRAAGSIGFAAIALNKTNADFLHSSSSCARVLNEGLVKAVPFSEPLATFLGAHAWGALMMEALLLPLLLAVPRLGVIYTWGFFVSVAMVGPRATCFVFMALSLVFLPASDLERLDLRSKPVVLGALASVSFATLFWIVALDETRRFAWTQLLGRVGFLSMAVLGLGLMAVNLWRSRSKRMAESVDEADETHGVESIGFVKPFRNGPRGARLVAGSILVLLLANELSPYLGLKTKYSLTMWSNLRADHARWNSFVFPGFLRVFGASDRALLSVTALQPLGQGSALVPTPVPFVAAHGTALAHIRQIEGRRGPLRFEVLLDGESHSFEGAGPGSAFERFIESTRPSVDWFEDAVMTLETPQGCLGP